MSDTASNSTSKKMGERYIGASIIVGVLFFIFDFLKDYFFEPNSSLPRDAFTAFIGALAFSIIFHYVHNFIANLFGWYDD